MTDDNPSLPPRMRHIPGHTDPASGLQQQDMQLWQHISLSQPQPSAGVQAVPVGIGFSSRPQQQIWPDHSTAFSQRGWQPFAQSHTQQSPQESQELTPQVVRSQHQNWPGGEMNTIQMQQLQQLYLLQQQQHMQQLQQQQQQQHQHQQEQQQQQQQSVHHLDPIGQHDDHNHEKFTKSPSPQIEENRNSPAVGRQFMHNMTSPQQQLWQHPQVVHQYDMQQHGEPQHTQQQAFQHTPVSHHQPLFAQQPYVQQVWPHHTPYSQVQVQHLRQSTPPIQQHVLWHQQQQQQLQQHQMQQQHHHQQHPTDPPLPYSPPSSSSGSFTDKPISLDKKELDMKNESLFNNMRMTSDPIVSRTDKLNAMETAVTTINTGHTPVAAPSLSMTTNNITHSPKPPIRILSKSNQNSLEPPVIGQVPGQLHKSPEAPSFVPQGVIQRPVQAVGSSLSNHNLNNNATSAVKSHSFNPNPNINPYQSMNTQNMMAKGLQQGLYGSQQTSPRFPSPVKEKSFGHSSMYRPRSPAAVVRNHQPQGVVINNVYQRTAPSAPGSNFHHVENVEVNIFVQGLNPRTRSDSIQNYFESVGKPACVKDNILFNLDHTEALVIFQQKPDILRLKQNIRARKLDGFSLDICEVSPPKAIVVSSDAPIRSTGALKHYFERDTVGGRLKKNGIDETEDGCCMLEFEDSRVVQRVCNSHRSHKVEGIILRVSPYYQCENGAIWDMNLHVVPIPKPVNIQILPDQLEFVKRYNQPLFTSRLRDKYADVSFFKDHVTVKCMLRQSMPNYRSQVRVWQTGIQEVVAKFLASYIDQADIGVPNNIWDKISEFLNSGRQELKDLLMKPDRERHSLKLVGNKSNVKNAQRVIESKIEALSRAARRKVETRKVKSAQHLAILEIQGTFTALSRKYRDLAVHVEGNEVTVEGDPTDIPNAFIDMYAECEKIEPTCYKHTNSKEWVNFVKKDNAKLFVQRRLDQKHLKGSWTVSNTEVSVYVPTNGKSDEIKDMVLKSVVENSIEVDKSSSDLLNSEVWGDFLLDLKRRCNERADVFTKKNLQVVALGLDTTVLSIVKQIQDFLDSKSVKNVVVQCDPLQLEFINQCWTDEDFAEVQKNDVVVKTKVNGLELTGLSENLIKGKQKLDLKLKRMCSKKHILRKTGVEVVLKTSHQSGAIASIEREFKCVIKLPKELQEHVSILSDYEMVGADSIAEDGPTSSSSSPKCFQTKHLKIKVHLVHGEIGHQKADVLAASAASNLNLRSGSASYSLLKQGGPQLQTECEKLYPNGVKDGEVAIVGPGNLHCDNVYLSSLPSWKEAGGNHGKVFRNFMRECLRLADRHSKKTIAFSAMGTSGFLGYPREVVASIVYGAMVEFDRSYKSTSITDISIILFSKDAETIKAYEEHEHMRLFGNPGTSLISTDFSNGKVKIELVTDDISAQKVDGLLCAVATDMNMKRSPICNSLVQAGGSALETDCKQKYKNELQVGQVADISSGNLPCKTVYLIVLPPFTESAAAEKSLTDILQQVFQRANLKGYKSIAMPALGTGALSYPKTMAAKCMYDAVLDWSTKNPKASLKTVRFVMYKKDAEAQQAYRICHLKLQERETRLARSFIGDGTVLVPQDHKLIMIKDGCLLNGVELTVHTDDLLKVNTDAIVVSANANFDMKGAIPEALAKKCPNILPECQQKKAELKKDGVVLTTGAELPASHIVHVLEQDTLAGWRAKMLTCLEEAHKLKLKSIAFPILSSGKVTFTGETMSDCLCAALDDFTSENPGSALVDVRVIVLEDKKSWKQAILAAFQARLTAAHSISTQHKILPALASVADKNSGNSKAKPKDNRTASANQRNTESLQVVVYSDAIINIDRCIKALDDKVGLEYVQRTLKLDLEVMKNFSDKEAERLVDASLLVDGKYDKKTAVFTLTGPSCNVKAAIDSIHSKVKITQHEKESKDAAKSLSSSARWHWLYEDGGFVLEEKPYPEQANYVIDMAYKDGKDTIQLVYKGGKVYVVDFKKLVEYPTLNASDTVKVARKDVLKASQVATPSSWMSMSNNENVKRVALTAGKEYTEVEKLFSSQVKTGLYASKQPNKTNLQIIKIERIQNRSLYNQYCAKKKVMEQQKLSQKLEQKLWHTTVEDNIPCIINNGFNRSYCGLQGVLFGQGVYFAADASFSVQDYLSSKKSATKRYMILTKALTGDYVKGNPSLRTPPVKSPSSPSVLYDSTVDDETKPMEFVLYHDTQAYPEYLITFTI